MDRQLELLSGCSQFAHEPNTAVTAAMPVALPSCVDGQEQMGGEERVKERIEERVRR
jgi:hypothetical protein